MKDEVYKYLEKKITTSEDSKDAFNFAKAYSEIIKAEAEQTRIDMAAIDQANRTEIEKAKIDAEIQATKDKIENDRRKIEVEEQNNKSRAENDRKKIEAEEQANKERAHNERRRYESEERSQRYRANRTSKDNALMAGVFGLAYAVTFGCELKGILLSKEARSLTKLIKFR